MTDITLNTEIKVQAVPPDASFQTAEQLREPNFRNSEGRLFLIRCFVCEPKFGRENYLPAVASGKCAFCGWKENKN